MSNPYPSANDAPGGVPFQPDSEDMAGLLCDGAEALGVLLAGEQVDEALEFLRLLVEQSRLFNLTAVRDPRDIAIKHFIDSMTVLPLLPENAPVALADVGTGAGFPGLALKIYRPDLDVSLIDCVAKRLRFVSLVIERLGLRGVTLHHARAEDLGRDAGFRERLDVVVARAVSPLRSLAEVCLPLVRLHGGFIAMKGPRADEELMEAAHAIRLLGGGEPALHRLLLPISAEARTLVQVPKSRPTPRAYPRRPHEIARKPL